MILELKSVLVPVVVQLISQFWPPELTTLRTYGSLYIVPEETGSAMFAFTAPLHGSYLIILDEPM